jgi:hypothetical protein
MFAVFSLIVITTITYRKAVGFEYEHVWAVSIKLIDAYAGFSGNTARPG